MDDKVREALEAGIRAANLALFVIRKQGIMPNSSWEIGFNRDLKTAEDGLAALSTPPAEPERDCHVCGPHPFSGIRDEGCLLPETSCPRMSATPPAQAAMGEEAKAIADTIQVMVIGKASERHAYGIPFTRPQWDIILAGLRKANG